MARHDGWRDVAEGAAGVGVMEVALLTPFSRGRRAIWGAGAEGAARRMLIGIKQRAERAGEKVSRRSAACCRVTVTVPEPQPPATG